MKSIYWIKQKGSCKAGVLIAGLVENVKYNDKVQTYIF